VRVGIAAAVCPNGLRWFRQLRVPGSRRADVPTGQLRRIRVEESFAGPISKLVFPRLGAGPCHMDEKPVILPPETRYSLAESGPTVSFCNTR
jgi:hypothetical protein